MRFALLLATTFCLSHTLSGADDVRPKAEAPLDEIAKIELLFRAVESLKFKILDLEAESTPEKTALALREKLKNATKEHRASARGFIDYATAPVRDDTLKLIVVVGEKTRIRLRDWLTGVLDGIELKTTELVATNNVEALFNKLESNNFVEVEQANQAFAQLRVAVVKDIGIKEKGCSFTRSPVEAWTLAVLSGVEVRIRPRTAIAPEKIQAFLKELGSERFEERENATESLVKLGGDVVKDVEACGRKTADAEVQARCLSILKAIEAPANTGLGVIQLIESTNATFIRSGTRSSLTPKKFATHLRGKAVLKNYSLAQPAMGFIDTIASESSLHGTPYRIQFDDGTERDLKGWLVERMKLAPEGKK